MRSLFDVEMGDRGLWVMRVRSLFCVEEIDDQFLGDEGRSLFDVEI